MFPMKSDKDKLHKMTVGEEQVNDVKIEFFENKSGFFTIK